MNNHWILSLSGWLYFAFIVMMLLAVLLRRKEASSALGWSLAIVFMPIVGSFMFLVFGINRIPRRLRRKIAHREAFVSRFSTMFRHSKGLGPKDEKWSSLSRLVRGSDGAPRRTGNQVRLLSDNVGAFEEMSTAIDGARHHIHVEFYIFRNDSLGRVLLDQLAAKSAQGVQVRLILDGVGSFSSRRLIRRLKKAGGAGCEFMPVFAIGKRFYPNLRNHRKIVICDGETAFFGGLNVGEEYLGRTTRRGSRDWRDLHVKLCGPSVWDVQRIFVEDWNFCTGEPLEDPSYFPLMESRGEASIQMIGSGPDEEVNSVRLALFALLTRATKRIHLATPYFVPDLALLDAMRTAALSGVEVKVVIPAPPADNFIVALCGEFYLEDLMQAGIRVFAYDRGMMHAKAVSVDGERAMVGSANFDNRSLRLNFEMMALFDAESDVQSIERELEDIMDQSKEIEPDHYRSMGWPRRLLTAGSRLLSPLL